MWRIGQEMTINWEAITLTRTTRTSMIVTSRPPTTLSVKPRQSGRTAGLRTVAAAETSLTEGSTVGGGESDERRYDEWNGGSSESMVSSVAQKPWHDHQPENVIKLLSGERLGWWSAQKFAKRVRMRALVQGAVKDARPRILLDTGANVSVISERFKTSDARMYEYELWVMDHGAGVDVVLGTDFMIPAGVHLDLFHAAARLLDEVEIPLVKTQRMADTREEDPHIPPDGPTKVLTIPGHESRDYRPMRQPPLEQQDRVEMVLNNHERIMISSVNALPPPAYGVVGVGDIDVQGHPPIKQTACRIPLRHLKQLYELLKWLLKAGVIAFSDRLWASPIVIALKKNGVDIRLRIDYKMVNYITAIMEYAMPLVDDLLTDMERTKEVHAMLFANDWALSTTLMQEHDGVMHPVCFCTGVLKDNDVNYQPAEKEVLALLLLLKTCYTQLAGRTINGYTRFSTLGWINTSKTIFGRSTQFAVMLSSWHQVVHREQASTLRTLSEDTATQRDIFFDFALKPRFITAITRQKVQAAKKRIRFAETHAVDSKALPVGPEPPDRPKDATTETTEPSHVENGEISPGAAERPPNAEDVDPLEVQEERRRSVDRAPDEELRWANLKLVLKGESSRLGYKAIREA
ncbi:unnamed protein product [Phytophthora fragariaefolia]|uniref:Unnamed protein product n=1 Tax=Phytophthora fragariaefolia TaxID=1490495 RepID=A0A9W6Y1B6_9STRA|nr:unnamed protein product [Phytophthora fragariaefolia]